MRTVITFCSQFYKFFSIEFNKLIEITNDLFLEYYARNSGISVKGALSL